MTLDEQIDEILVDSVGMDFCENKACSHYEQYLLAKQSIHALIADQVREARIDELEAVDKAGKDHFHRDEVRTHYIIDRIAELKKEQV